MKSYQVIGSLAFLLATETQALTGREIAERMDQVDRSADSSREATMVIQRGSQKLMRKMNFRSKRYDQDERSLIRFVAPADVRDTQYLSWTYEEISKEDDLWVFFPSENLIRRISGGGKKGSFMRSDFANEDIEQRSIDDDTHELVETSELDGTPVYILESTPIPAKAKDSNYGKRRSWVDQSTWLSLKIEFYDRRGRLLKVLSQGGIEQIDGIWTATKLIMETPRKKSKTLMQYENVRYNLDLDDTVFEHTSLKR